MRIFWAKRTPSMKRMRRLGKDTGRIANIVVSPVRSRSYRGANRTNTKRITSNTTAPNPYRSIRAVRWAGVSVHDRVKALRVSGYSPRPTEPQPRIRQTHPKVQASDQYKSLTRSACRRSAVPIPALSNNALTAPRSGACGRKPASGRSKEASQAMPVNCRASMAASLC